MDTLSIRQCLIETVYELVEQLSTILKSFFSHHNQEHLVALQICLYRLIFKVFV